MASRWITALVEPPMAPLVRMAFSKASLVSTFEIVRSSSTISTMRRPAMWARALRRESAAGMAALVGRPMPKASTMQAMVEAVPMVMQWPVERALAASASMKSARLISPVLTMASNFQRSVPEPTVSPL